MSEGRIDYLLGAGIAVIVTLRPGISPEPLRVFHTARTFLALSGSPSGIHMRPFSGWHFNKPAALRLT